MWLRNMPLDRFKPKVDPLSFDEDGRVMCWVLNEETMSALAFVFGELLHAYDREVRQAIKDLGQSKIAETDVEELGYKRDLAFSLWGEIDLEIREDHHEMSLFSWRQTKYDPRDP